ncbi:MAG: HD domain-containing phosphohydrolase, partial [Bdellovibrionota bacterium]
YQRTEVRVGKIVEFLTSEKGAIRGILGATGCSIDNFQHSASVSSLTLALAMKVGIQDPQELLDLALAGLLHDIGKTKLGIGPATPREALTREQLKEYHRHPVAAVEMLAGKKFVNARVLRLISDHEEIGNGNGFPEKKMLSKLPLNSQILNLCNEFDRLSATLKISHLTLYPKFQAEKIGLFALEHMKILNELIQTK